MDIINIIPFAKPVGSHFLVVVIDWLVGISSVAVGIILFTLILKLITLPFDFFSRASMRKNSIKMEEMRPELEKLQKQYANDKTLYNQKMMALYKKNGYSMFGACLPTIITLVIFIIAMRGFTVYSQFQNKQQFYDMSNAYNNVIYAGMETDDTYITLDEKGALVFSSDLITGDTRNITITNADDPSKNHDIIILKGSEVVSENTLNFYTIETTNSYIRYKIFYTTEDGVNVESGREIYVPSDKLSASNLKVEANNQLKNEKGESYSGTTDAQATEFIKDICQTKSAQTFRSKKLKFLWVKNIWEKDSPLSHPVQSSWSSFKSEQGYSDYKGTAAMTEEHYKELISKLEYEKNTQNGYFILAILTAAISFLTQFVITKSQKAQMELQTVNGQGAQTQKMMMWMMPIMMAVFSFLYTATFSIYMIMSSVISIVSTLAINKIVDLKYKNAKVAKEENQVIRGRVYTPKQEEIKEEPKKKQKKVKAENKNDGDFLKDTKKSKHFRGRLK